MYKNVKKVDVIVYFVSRQDHFFAQYKLSRDANSLTFTNLRLQFHTETIQLNQNKKQLEISARKKVSDQRIK